MAKMLEDLHYVAAVLDGTTTRIYLAHYSVGHGWADWSHDKSTAKLVNRDFNLDPLRVPGYQHRLIHSGGKRLAIASLILEPYQPVHVTKVEVNRDDAGPTKSLIGEPKRALEQDQADE